MNELFSDLPAYLGGHLLLSVTALAVGIAISVPLGVLASRRPRLAEWALGVAGVLQTVPSLALLALMVPLLGGAIGFRPAFIAMTLYSFLPILANTVIGLKGVDPALIEAARGLGMSERQMLFRVQLPLAAPVIIAGIRTATVLVVGTATLATPVGQATLGNYIFAGLNMRDNASTIFGCALAAVLALVLDQLVRLLEVAARRRSSRLAWVGALGLLLVLGGGLYAPIARAVSFRPAPVIVGSSDYTEQFVLGELLKGHLRARNFEVDSRQCMGESILFDALRDNEIDCFVSYTGNIWTTVMKPEDRKGDKASLEEISAHLRGKYDITCLGPLGYENAYALAMPRARARELGIASVADLANYREHANWKIGGDTQFFRRPEWTNIRTAYGLAFNEYKDMSPTLMYPALQGKSVDVIVAYTSDGRIEADDLVVLEDTKKVFPPYDAVLLLSPQAIRKPGLREALLPLIRSINVEMMREANRQVDVNRRSPREAGRKLVERIEEAGKRVPGEG